ncbi:MAG: AAA family ATPase [Polyangiaceae bacterium]
MGTIMTVPAGVPAVRQIKLAYQANLPVLLHGRHGVGKSEIIRAAAAELGVSVVVRDLSVMEPPDLIGIPRVGADGRTYYAPPAFLPTGGSGLLVFEELNRAPRYVVAPCLQLLTARCLNDYELPGGWVPCGAVNDADDGYHVEELDPALLSRFVRIKIQADQREWCAWARGHDVHPKVVAFVDGNPKIFSDPQSNPRAWTYVSRLLHAADAGSYSPDELVVGIAGLVGEVWSGAFADSLGGDTPLTALKIIDAYQGHAGIVRRWKKEARLDLLRSSWINLRNHLQRQATFDAVVAQPAQKKNVENFLRELVPDLAVQARGWFEDRGLTGLTFPRPRAA